MTPYSNGYVDGVQAGDEVRVQRGAGAWVEFRVAGFTEHDQGRTLVEVERYTGTEKAAKRRGDTPTESARSIVEVLD